MKICIINNLYKPFVRGGAETVVENIVEGLKRAGHEVVVITSKPFFKKIDSNSEGNQIIYYINGFYYELSAMPKFLRLPWHFIDMFDIGSYWRVKNIFKKEKPDFIITHNLKGLGYLIPRAIKSLGIKHAHTLHDIQLLHPSGLLFRGKEDNINSVFSKIYQYINKKLFLSPTIVISPSKWLLQIHDSRGFFVKSKKAVFANPINFNLGRQPKNPFKKNNIFKFLYVGQIDEYKGIFLLIDAFNLLQDRLGRKDCELTIIGDGRGFKKAQNKIAGNNNIKLTGRKNREEVSERMLDSNCLIMPSLCYENSPMVIYEAFAAELPVLASDIGGISELMESGAGILFDTGNVNDLTRQMKWAIENQDKLKELAEKGRMIIENNNADEYIKKLLDLI